MLRKLLERWNKPAAGSPQPGDQLIPFCDWCSSVNPSGGEPISDIGFERLRTALLCGLSEAAMPSLERLAARDSDAARELAEFHATRGDYAQALHHLEVALKSSHPTQKDEILLIHGLVKNGRAGEAQMKYDQVQQRAGPTSDLLLLGANLAPSSGWARYLEQINTIYRRCGLCEIEPKMGSETRSYGEFTAKTPYKLDEPENRVSILVPAYNAEKLLPFALESLIAQTWQNIEIIVVDDCSVDGTAAVAQDFAGRDPRVVFLQHAKNSGAYPARNTALRRATGRLVTVHDADDWAHPQKIELQVKHMLETGSRLSASSGIRVRSDMFINLRAPQRTHLMPVFTSFMFERTVALDLGGWDTVRMGADAEFFGRLTTLLGGKFTDPLPEVPLSFILSSETSLTGHSFTGVQSITFGARKHYIEAYRHWHRSLTGLSIDKYRLDADKRPFPAPRIFFHRDGKVSAEKVFMFDFTREDPAMLREIAFAHRAGVNLALIHWPRLHRKLSRATSARLVDLIVERSLPVVVPGESVEATSVVLSDKDLLQTVPDGLPEISAFAYSFLKGR